MKLLLYCPKLKSRGTVDILRCLFLCPKAEVVRCPEYTKTYPTLKSYVVPVQYAEKYGTPAFQIPIKYRKRRKRSAPCSTPSSD